MYTRNKVVTAREQGYYPIVFHSGIGEKIYIEDLKQYDQYEFPEFRYEPCVISKNRKKRLINRIESILKDCDEDSVLESHEILVAEWGEWIAEKLKIRHLAYMLLEHNVLSQQTLYDFFKFKYERHELAGIARNTIPDMFRNFAQEVEGFFLPAFCINVYEDIPCKEEFKTGNADFTIGTIGRANKRYVQPMIDSILRFVSKYSDKTFNVLYVGGAADKSSEKKVIARLSTVPNVRLFFTGMIFPISIEMIRQMDVCIASAASCSVSHNCGIPTIAIDANDSKAIGIFGKTTRNKLFRNTSEPQIEIEDLLKEVLIDKKYMKIDQITRQDVDHSKHWKFIEDMSPSREYFDVNTIKCSFKRKCTAIFLGYYYGLKPSSVPHRLIERLLGFLK